ncbi:MAG: PAS domain-containing protein, partial [Sideroxyarcus sp.]|nr:PAS domain-containing protein [Sideroxyarcus sp.]
MNTVKNISPTCKSTDCQAMLEYQALLNNATLGIAVTRDRTFQQYNERWAEMYGWPDNELIGQATLAVYPSSEAFAELSRIAIPLLGSSQKLDTELIMKKRDG